MVPLFSGPSGIQPVVKAAPITVHDSDSEDEEESMGTRACITNNIAQNYSDGEEKTRDPVETKEPSGVEQLGEGWTVFCKICSSVFQSCLQLCKRHACLFASSTFLPYYK